MIEIKTEIQKLSKQLHKQVISYRRHIHQNPELSFQEFETAKFIKSILSEYNISTDDSFGDNAVIGIIEGEQNGISIALRADTDALAIEEQNSCEYKSTNQGIMHACGHDAHSASLLGTAIVLNSLKAHIKVRIILVFQPAEEKNPGGAKILIDKGLVTKYDIKKFVGQHVLPEAKTGTFLFGDGMQMASTDELYISFNGIGGHAAIPKKRSDTVMALVDFITAVKAYEKTLENNLPFIIAFGKLEAKGAVNVIPDQSLAQGTMRTFDENLRKAIQIKLVEIANECAIRYDCSSDFNIAHGYPSLENDKVLTEQASFAAKEYIGEKNIGNLELKMTAEDFAYYSKEVPSVFYRAGISGNKQGNIGLHNPKFNIDEDIFIHTVGMMAYIAIKISE